MLLRLDPRRAGSRQVEPGFVGQNACTSGGPLGRVSDQPDGERLLLRGDCRRFRISRPEIEAAAFQPGRGDRLGGKLLDLREARLERLLRLLHRALPHLNERPAPLTPLAYGALPHLPTAPPPTLDAPH